MWCSNACRQKAWKARVREKTGQAASTSPLTPARSQGVSDSPAGHTSEPWRPSSQLQPRGDVPGTRRSPGPEPCQGARSRPSYPRQAAGGHLSCRGTPADARGDHASSQLQPISITLRRPKCHQSARGQQSCPVRSPSGSATGDSRERAAAERTGALPLPEALNHRSAVQRNDLLGLAGPVHEGRQILPGVPGQPPVFGHAGR
jgi:hypothetical protein